MTEKVKFPEGFLWGAATAAHQVEGNLNNNWSRWEATVASKLAKDARERLAAKVPDYNLIRPEAEDPDNYISGRAVDHYHRYQEDVEIMNRLGLKSYRFSIEWSRVEPEPGQINKAEVEHYQRLIKELKASGIEPFVVLHHFSNPQWFDDQGGWHHPKAPIRFKNYAKVLSQAFGADIKYWITINEPGSYLLMRYLGGGAWPQWPGMQTKPIQGFQCINNFIKAHKAARNVIRAANPDSQVGMDHMIVDFKLGRKDPVSWLMYKAVRHLPDGYMLKRLNDHADFIGVHYYVRMVVKSRMASVREWAEEIQTGQQTDMGWQIYPEGIYNVTQRLKAYNLPVYVTENGLADVQDRQRAQFITQHLKWLRRSIAAGADIRGYFYWSLLDNFEWSEGFWPKFGLVEVDRKTMQRKVRPSAQVYKEIIRNNGFELQPK